MTEFPYNEEGCSMELISKLTGALLITALTCGAVPAPADQETTTAAATSELTTGSTSELEAITVNANKRRESLQDVPISVTAITAQTAAAVGVTDISSLQTTVPGLEFPRLFSGSSPALRGIGTSFGIGGEENVVALYIDDVYIASPSATTFAFNNIDQIEVLRGPQGTLFGRNAMAGVIDITTRTPSDVPKADLTFGYANYGTYSGSFYGSYPISDRLSADLAVSGNDQRNGWGTNFYTGLPVFTEQDFSARSKWVFKPDSDTTFTLIGDFSHTIYDEGIAMRPVQGALFPDGQAFQGYYNLNENVSSFVDAKQSGVSLKIERNLGWANLTSVAAYRKSRAFNNSDEDQSVVASQYLPIYDDLSSISEEIRLSSRDSTNLYWLAGLFYFHDLAKLDLTDTGSALGGLTLVENFNQTIDSYAGFGQATYDLPAGVHLTAGLRYTYDEIKKDAGETLAPVLTETSVDGTTESKWTYKVAIQKDLTATTSAYVSYSTGFKGGIYNSNVVNAPAVKPETLSDVEGGIKSELFDRRLRLNAAVYHYDYKNLQVASLTRAATGQTTTNLANAAQATNTGFELDAEAKPIDNLTLRAGLEFMHSRFASFPNATISIALPGGGNETVSGSAKGFMTPHSPNFSGNFGPEYRFATPAGDMLGSLNYSYSSAFAWDADNRLKQHAYGMLNGSIRWMPPGNQWEFMLWGKNLTDVQYSIYTTANVVGDEESPAPPRTFGVTVSHHFF
jgi:iron complex outermembrane receptor protein